MKESFWGYLILLFGIFIIVIMMIIRDYQTTSDEDYYILKEVTQAAMIDAIDYAYYREHNDLRIIEEKFAENFLRRFAENMSSNKTYKIQLYEINENPPKVSIRVTTATGEYVVEQDQGAVDFGVVSILSAILDMKHENVVYNNDYIGGGGSAGGESFEYLEKTYYSVSTTKDTGNKFYQINIHNLPNGIDLEDIIDVQVTAEVMESSSDFNKYVSAKIAEEMTLVGSTTPSNLNGLSATNLKKYSLTKSNFTTFATGRCSNAGCTLSISNSITSFAGATAAGTVTYDNGVVDHNVYYVPVKMNVKFVYDK